MPGLLDWYQDPSTQQLLGLSAGLLAAGGPNARPTSVGQGMSQGLLMGSNLANDARRGQLMDLQGKTMQTSLDSQQRSQKAIDEMAAQIQDPLQKQRFLVDPAGYLKALNEAYTLSPGQTRMHGANVIAQSAPNLNFQDLGSGVQGINPQTGAPVGSPIQKSMSPDATARLAWDQYQWGNISPHQRATLGLDAARVANQGIQTQYDTGRGVMGGGINPPPNAPMPNFTGLAPTQNLFNPVNAPQLQARPPSLPAAPQVPVAPQMPGAANLPPKLANEIEAARLKNKGEMENKREVNMGGLNETLNEAEKILRQGTKDPVLGGKNAGAAPTGSGFGAAMDWLGAQVGISTASGEQADKLKALGGALVTKMPRMEGPQSNLDVELYREMAGRIGDASIPVARRLEALDTVRKLWGKYDKSSQPRVVDW